MTAGLKLVQFENAEPFDERVTHSEVSNELHTLAESIDSPDGIYFDSFYSFFETMRFSKARPAFASLPSRDCRHTVTSSDPLDISRL